MLETFPNGGILLDLRSGILCQINTTAAFVWERLLAGMSPGNVAPALAEAFELSESAAQRDVETAQILPSAHAFPRWSPDFRYEPVDGGYRISACGIPVLEIDASGKRLRSLSGFRATEAGLYLRTVTPKFVALLGTSVLHASAVARPNGTVMAFLGQSGAGKTTTARAFSQTGTGWRIVCEDKLVLRQEGGQLAAVLNGEANIMTWMASAREHLMAGNGGSCDASELAKVAEGPALPVADVVLIDGTRSGTAITLKRLDPAEAARRIFPHGFYGSSAEGEWRRQVRVTANLARTARTCQAIMPHGLDALDEATRRYTETTTS